MVKSSEERQQACWYSQTSVSRTITALNGVSPNPGFAAGKRVAFTVEHFVALIVLFSERAEIVFALPAVDRRIGAGNISIAQQLGSQIIRRRAEEFRPGTFRAIGGLKRGNFLVCNLKLPDNNEHVDPSPVLS